MAQSSRGQHYGGRSPARDAGRVVEPDCVAVVPAYLAESTLAATLESLTRDNRDGVRRVVVVASPGDRSASVAARFDRVDVIRTERRVSAGRARNLGRRAAGEARYILFVDADCRLAPGAARALAKACEKHALAAAGAPIRAAARSPVSWARHLLEFKDSERGVSSRWPWMLPSAALLCRSDAFDRVGGFPDLWPGEDLVFCHRLQAAGLAARRVDAAMATHAHPGGIWRMICHQFRLGATSAVARRITGMAGVGFVRRPWAIPALFGGRLARSVLWVLRERPRDLGRLVVCFPLVVGGLIAWSTGFASDALSSRGTRARAEDWRWV